MAQAPKPEDTQPVAPLDSASFPPPALSGGADLVRLEMRVEELERRLNARTMELETEIRGKERLRSRIEELTRRISELEETASSLHREAVSATALSQELDEALRVASEARRHLDSALEAERGRRESAEKELDGLRPALQEALTRAETAAAHEAMKREGELRDAKRMVQAARQKIDGHEAHIDSLRSEVEEARRLEQEAEKYCADLESKVLDAEERARSVMENAETIRREGVEAFEKAREASLRLQLQEDKFRRESAGLEALKSELRARAEREMLEMRRALDAERERMHLDMDADRRGAAALGRETPSERLGRLKDESEERSIRIAQEAQESIAPEPVAPAPEPWQASDEVRILLWVAIGVSLVASMVASVLFFQN